MKKDELLNGSIVGLFFGILFSRLFLFLTGTLSTKNAFFEYIVIHPSFFTTTTCLVLVIIIITSKKLSQRTQ